MPCLAPPKIYRDSFPSPPPLYKSAVLPMPPPPPPPLYATPQSLQARRRRVSPASHLALHDVSSLPPLNVCNRMNAHIRTNPLLDSPYFDLAGHVGSRVYEAFRVPYAHDADTETAAFLDVGVRRLLPTPVPRARTAAPKGSTFSIQATPGGAAGQGMFASRNIPAGGTVLVERPAVVVPYLMTCFDRKTEADVYASLLRRLSPECAARLMGLANCTQRPGLEGVILTNAIAITLDVPEVPHAEVPTHRAVFLNTSRCNHSCGPNAQWRWDPTTFSLTLRALRPIPATEEITVAYVTPTHPHAARQKALKALYNFTCRCPHCLRPNDAARAELHAFWGAVPARFEAWCVDARLPDHLLIDAHKRAVQLIEAEGLETLGYCRHLDAIAMGYGALGEAEEFRAWSRRARDLRPIDTDERRDELRVMLEWIDEPEKFPVWGWRRCLSEKRKTSPLPHVA
ncbi:unnamed protein product [Mycena citricolor]|uniref:SET domain-containing protein n=1 Tax=Mycena citricolor TaxID=2018698 RepID=A0AAD2H1Z6_9AGAR|nr:unnamed protein product [Mycena citricolor]